MAYKSAPHFIAGSDLIRDNTQPPSSDMGPETSADADEGGVISNGRWEEYLKDSSLFIFHHLIGISFF